MHGGGKCLQGVQQSIVPFSGRSSRRMQVSSMIKEIIITHCHLAFDPGYCNNDKPMFPSSSSFYSLYSFSAKRICFITTKKAFLGTGKNVFLEADSAPVASFRS
jgi:hypothetical protein